MHDLKKAGIYSVPITLIILIVVFGLSLWADPCCSR